jgi:hypothetical protein
MTAVLVSLPWAVLSVGLLYVLTRAQDRAHAERQQLLQRIQAPDVAVAQHVDETVAGPEGLRYVPIDDDELWHQNFQEQMNGA